ncbi:hypothetical protein MIR68_009091 [Amoeboaphelidium protococcarum]|nr:hypothetical protein MIR68_009091 [Amoeboaphelidium protococcarum]
MKSTIITLVIVISLIAPQLHGASVKKIDQDPARCGEGVSCKRGKCCSGHGWCGNSADHCGLGCQLPWSHGLCDSMYQNPEMRERYPLR